MKNKIKDGSRNIGLGIILILIWIIGGARFYFSISAEALGSNFFSLLLIGGGVYFIIKGLKQRKIYKQQNSNKKEDVALKK